MQTIITPRNALSIDDSNISLRNSFRHSPLRIGETKAQQDRPYLSYNQSSIKQQGQGSSYSFPFPIGPETPIIEEDDLQMDLHVWVLQRINLQGTLNPFTGDHPQWKEDFLEPRWSMLPFSRFPLIRGKDAEVAALENGLIDRIQANMAVLVQKAPRSRVINPLICGLLTLSDKARREVKQVQGFARMLWGLYVDTEMIARGMHPESALHTRAQEVTDWCMKYRQVRAFYAAKWSFVERKQREVLLSVAE
jgi:hypothetical protein